MADPRDAATIILAKRSQEGSYEILLTRRPDTMRFMGGTFVFPGGALDAEDCGEAMEALSALSADEARDRIGEGVEPRQALGLFCCAIRELFEEVGILLARDESGNLVDPLRVRTEYAVRHRAEAREARSFARFLAAEGLTLATDLLVWHGRLITPESSPIRFDARFFVAPMPDGQALLLDPEEVPEALWISPVEAIRAAGDKRLPIPIPTMSILQGLSEVPGYAQLMRGTRVTREIVSTGVSPLVWHVLAPNPGLATGPGTNTWIVGRGEVAIIDPAVPDPVYIERLTKAAGDRGRITTILLTHMHPDHTGGASVLSEQTGVPVAAWRGTMGTTSYVSRPIEDGDTFALGGATLRAVYTPGHASHHVCFVLDEEQALFAGDVVAGLGTVVISPPDGNMADYLTTLERLLGLGCRRIYPGHGPIVEDGPAKLREYIAHRKDREAQVVAALEAGDAAIPAMVKRIYTEVPQALHAMAELSVLAHLEMLEGSGRVRRTGAGWTLADGRD